MTGNPGNIIGGKTMHTLAGGSDFPTTRWTLVIAAADSRRTEARSALVSLCESYWYPLYAYVRRRGYPADQLGYCGASDRRTVAHDTVVHVGGRSRDNRERAVRSLFADTVEPGRR